MNQNTILITGASSGIGAACCKYLGRRGHKVYGASRSMPLDGKDEFKPVRMDVRDGDSVQKTVDRILGEEGRIDVLVNCAGMGIVGAIEETTVEEAQAEFNTNFFGVHRLCRAVLPAMRGRRSGLIVNVSSLAGLMGIPFQAFYSASKFALEGFTEALRMEVLQFGIRVVLIEPGDFKTHFTLNRTATEQSRQSLTYRESCMKSLAVMEHDEQNGKYPLPVAHLIERIMHDLSPRLRYTIGPWSERLSPKLRVGLPYKIYERLFMKYFKLT